MSEPSLAVRKKVNALIAFVEASRGALPRRRSEASDGSVLAAACRDLKSRCDGPIRGGSKPNDSKLTPTEIEHFGLLAAARKKTAADVDHKKPCKKTAAEPHVTPGVCSTATGSSNSSSQQHATITNPTAPGLSQQALIITKRFTRISHTT
jgi:hypothetical protein